MFTHRPSSSVPVAIWEAAEPRGTSWAGGYLKLWFASTSLGWAAASPQMTPARLIWAAASLSVCG